MTAPNPFRVNQNWNSKLGFEAEQSFLAESASTQAEQSRAEPTTEQTFNSLEVQQQAKASLDFLAAMAMPTVFEYFFPATYHAIWQWLISHIVKVRDFSQLALGIPRGFAKTTLIKLFILYTILFTARRFILVMCENQTKGNAIISDVIDMLNEQNIKKVFGDWNIGAETDRQDVKKFGFRGRNIILMASTVATVRGINLKNERPDLMIFDDIQSRADAESEVISNQIESDMIGTAMKAKSPKGCLFVFIGNMYPTKFSILRKLKNNSNWIKFIAGGILENGTSLWEDLQPIEQLKKEFLNDLKAGRPEIFYAEVLNDENASVNSLIDISKIPACTIPEDEIHSGNFIIIDPSTDKKDSDAVSIGYFEIHNTIPVLKEVTEGRLSPGDTIREAIRMALSRNCRLVGIESNAYQYTLAYWFSFICQQLGIIGLEAVEVYSGSYSKHSRIMNMFKQLLAGEVQYVPEVSPAVNLQITQFNPMKRDNTDGILDLLAYAPKMIELYGPQIATGNILEMQEMHGLKISSTEMTSSF
jgi:hypothetical protein